MKHTTPQCYQINPYCLADVLDAKGGGCFCPECCAKARVTAVYTVEDFRPGVRPLGWWAKVVCSEKLGLLVKERIVPGWPCGPWKEGKARSVGGP